MEIKRRKKGLNLRRKRFVAEYIIDFNAARAARAAGYSNRNNTARIKGHQLLQEPVVQEAINAEMRERAKRTKIDQDKVLYDLEHQRQLAIKNRQFTPAMRASELHGRHLAMFTDKVLNEYDVVMEIKANMKLAQLDLVETLKKIAGENEIKEIEVKKEVDTLRIKRRKKRSKVLLPEKTNGDREKINKNLLHSDDTDDPNIDTDPPEKQPSLEEWQPLSRIFT